MRIILMFNLLKGIGNSCPIVVRIEQWDKVDNIKIIDNHIINTFGLDATVGTSQPDFAVGEEAEAACGEEHGPLELCYCDNERYLQ